MRVEDSNKFGAASLPQLQRKKALPGIGLATGRNTLSGALPDGVNDPAPPRTDPATNRNLRVIS
jgi:hypothetical protein